MHDGFFQAPSCLLCYLMRRASAMQTCENDSPSLLCLCSDMLCVSATRPCSVCHPQDPFIWTVTSFFFFCPRGSFFTDEGSRLRFWKRKKRQSILEAYDPNRNHFNRLTGSPMRQDSPRCKETTRLLGQIRSISVEKVRRECISRPPFKSSETPSLSRGRQVCNGALRTRQRIRVSALNHPFPSLNSSYLISPIRSQADIATPLSTNQECPQHHLENHTARFPSRPPPTARRRPGRIQKSPIYHSAPRGTEVDTAHNSAQNPSKPPLPPLLLQQECIRPLVLSMALSRRKSRDSVTRC